MQETFRALVLTYKTAPVDVREQVSLTEGGVKQFFQYFKEFTTCSDVLIISTCNRTEFYYRAEKDYSEEIFKGFRVIKTLSPGFEKHFHAFAEAEAVRHLFDVSIGLDAQVIGDLQISGQVKNAYQWSADENMAGPYLHRLMHTVFYVNKRVVQETAFRDGAASLSYAAKELVEELAVGHAQARVLVVGVGEIGRDVCLNLSHTALENVTIMNRTSEKAEKLAQECGFKAAPLSELKKEIHHSDIIISSVSGSSPIVVLDMLEVDKIFSHKYFIDLSMPRSIDPKIENLNSAVVYNLDDLRTKTNEAVEKRIAAIPQVNEIIQEAIEDFKDWSKEMIFSPTIQKLKNALEAIRQEELVRYLKHANPSEAVKLEEFSKNLVQKFLKLPVLQLKAACKRGEVASLVEVLALLFDLEKEKVDQ